MQIDPRTFQVRREAAMRASIQDDFGVKKGLARLREFRMGRGYGYRRKLLTRALRVTRGMSGELADIVTECKDLIGYDRPVEVYLTPEPVFNASCQREGDHGPTILTLSSRLLEAFTPAELRFVIGHELGHAVYDHYALPMPILATMEEMGIPFVQRPVALQLYAWCRAAELSADRVGLICARDPEAAASGFFKLASGVSSEILKPDLQAFAQQVNSLASAPEARKEPRDDDDTLDCFSTHPYNPVRVRAVWAFSRSKPYLEFLGLDTSNALEMADVEAIIDRDLSLMEPTYLQEKGDEADILRRLLYTAGIAVADAYNGIESSELEALSMLLGSEYTEAPDEPRKVLKDLPGRIRDALELSLGRRAQLLQHLTIIAAADGEVQEEELRVMEQIGYDLGVDARVIHHTIHGAMHPMD